MKRKPLSTQKILVAEQEHVTTKKPSWKRTRRNLRALIITVIYVIIGVAFFHSYEGWDILTSVYFITNSACTVGYGDFHPTNDKSRIFSIVYFFVGVIIMINVVGLAMEDFIDFVVMEFYKASKKSTDDCSHPLTPQEELQILVTRNVSLVILLAASVLLGGVFFKQYEGWSYIASCYFTFVTVMSIGYGDLVVETWQSRAFLILYMLVTISIVTVTIGSFAKIKMMLSTIKLKESLLRLTVDREFLTHMDMDGDKKVSKFEFVVAMLLKSGAVEGVCHVAPLMEAFDELDMDGSGELSIEDLLHAQTALGPKHKSANRKILSTKHLFKKLRAFTASFEVSENVLSKFSREDLIQFGVTSKSPTDLSTGSAAGFYSDDGEEKGGADAANTSAIGKDGVQRKAADDNRSDNKGEGQDADASCIHNTLPASPKTIAPNRASVQGANFYEAGWW